MFRVGRCCPLSVLLYNHFRTTETLVLDLDDVTLGTIKAGYFGSYLVTSLLNVLILYLEVLFRNIFKLSLFVKFNNCKHFFERHKVAIYLSNIFRVFHKFHSVQMFSKQL